MAITIPKIGPILNKTIVTKVTEAKVIIGNREVDLIIEVTTREVEVITKMIIDRITGAEAMEEVTAMSKVKITIGQNIKGDEAVAPIVDCGEPKKPIREAMDLPRQVQGIHNIKEYHNIDTYVVFVIAEGIMTISVIPSNICFMLCNNKVVKICHKLILTIIIQIKQINRLFKAGIPQP